MRVFGSPKGSKTVTRGPLVNRVASPGGVVVGAGAMFALVLALRLSVTLPGFAFALLFAVPVAIVAERSTVREPSVVTTALVFLLKSEEL